MAVSETDAVPVRVNNLHNFWNNLYILSYIIISV